MSIMKKIEESASLVEASRKTGRIAESVRSLHESGLDKKCPNLVKMFESADKNTQYQAANMVRLLENTAAKVAADYHMNLLTEDVTTAGAMLQPGVATLTPRVLDIVNRH